MTTNPSNADEVMDLAPMPVVPRQDVTLHILDQGGVLFDAAQQTVYALNTTGTFIWGCLEEGLSGPAIRDRLAAVFGLSHADAIDYFETAARQWQDLHLIDPTTGQVGGPPVTPAGTPWVRERSGVGPEAPIAAHYQLLDLEFRLAISSPALGKEVQFLLAPLATNRRPADSALIELAEDESGYIVSRNRQVYGRCAREEQAVPLLKTCLVEMALEQSGDFGAVHAAAVLRNGRCLLLPGMSGAGKSTLAAGLVASGFQLMGDDTIVLARDTLEARPIPFSICLKEGAWGLLERRFPELAERPVHHRLDGKRVRYLAPSRDRLWVEPYVRQRVTHLIFLNRVPEAKSRLVSITRSDALTRLAEGFYPLGAGLTATKIEQLVTWIAQVDCQELRYSPLDDGVGVLTKLCT